MANVAHLVRASGCGSEGSGFDPRHSPQGYSTKKDAVMVSFLLRCSLVEDDLIRLLGSVKNFLYLH